MVLDLAALHFRFEFRRMTTARQLGAAIFAHRFGVYFALPDGDRGRRRRPRESPTQITVKSLAVRMTPGFNVANCTCAVPPVPSAS